jgi:indole-3-glycerol phosphate synthase
VPAHRLPKIGRSFTRNVSRTTPEVQASRSWIPPVGALGRILERTAERVHASRSAEARLRDLSSRAAAPPSLRHALKGSDGLAIIAEVKRMSPSRGVINTGIDAVGQARAFQNAGASAVSVLTESEHFGGSLDDLQQVSGAVRIPVLRKDFCIDSLQLLEARSLGASAMLLIVRALPPEKLLELASFAHDIGLETLIEIRTEWELELALEIPDQVIGVNNRDLESLVIDRQAGQQLIPLIPPSRVAVFESGVMSRMDVEFAAATGADAVLVGSALSAAPDPGVLLKSLRGVPKVQRADRN